MIDFEQLRQLMREARTVRRFKEDKIVETSTLRNLVELTRFCPSGRNAQPLRYLLINSPEDREKIFPLLKWAGYFADWDGPEKGERPAAYLIQCLDTNYGKNCLCDDGLQLEAIILGMNTLGLKGCVIKAFDFIKLAEVMNLPERYVPRYVLALGYPAEEIKLEDMTGSDDADFKYYRTPDGIHHVPKRPLDELIIK